MEWLMIDRIRPMMFLLFCGAQSCLCCAQEEMAVERKTKGKTVELMARQAEQLTEKAESSVGKSFLKAARRLPPIEPFDLYYRFENPSQRRPLAGTEGIPFEKFRLLEDSERKKYTKLRLTEEQYYFTKYGSPVMFLRALDLVGNSGLKTLAGKKIVDFGFGSIGHLQMMAFNGADVTGIDVDVSLKGLYSRDLEPDSPPRRNSSKLPGKLRLLFGRFPADKTIAEATGTGIDIFFSKNTLKRGYIHPAQPVDSNRRIDLGVSDTEFIQAVYNRLNPGGFFMIYNLHPRRTPPGENYITWSDGRSPFDRIDLGAVGFKIIQFNCDDTPMAHEFAKTFGWDKQMNLEEDFRATFTLLQK